MADILDTIYNEKKREVAELYQKQRYGDIKKYYDFGNKGYFKSCIAEPGKLNIIGEIKRRSPSKGLLSNNVDPITTTEKYIHGGVSAISVLTDHQFFGGSLDDLNAVVKTSQRFPNSKIGILRKEFIIDPIQLVESVNEGAHAILLIVSMLKDKTKSLLDQANKIGLDSIVEVHNKEELNYAMSIDADIIGINNRNLNNFEEDINICLELKKLITNEDIVTIAESAIRTAEDFQNIQQNNFNAVLIGEALVKADNPFNLLKTFNAVR